MKGFIFLFVFVPVVFCDSIDYVKSLGSISVKSGKTECFPHRLDSFSLKDGGADILFSIQAGGNIKMTALMQNEQGNALSKVSGQGNVNVSCLLTSKDVHSVPKHQFCVQNDGWSNSEVEGAIFSKAPLGFEPMKGVYEKEQSSGSLNKVIKILFKIALAVVVGFCLGPWFVLTLGFLGLSHKEWDQPLGYVLVGGIVLLCIWPFI